MSTAKAFVPVVLLSVGLVGCTSPDTADTPDTPDTSGPPAELKLENLMRRSLADEFTPGREVVVSHVEIPPHTTMDRHWHPGEEFHYYLEGEVEIVIEGDTSFVGTPGTAGHVPYRKTHTAVTGEEGATVLVFRVHTEGEPVRYLEEGGTSEK